MSDLLTAFHFLRPLWLLLLPLLVLLSLWLRHCHHSSNNAWQTLIRPELLTHLLERQPSRRSRWPLAALCCGWILALLALAGPTWEKLPQPLYSQQDALVLILDLSPSMRAQDLKPDRLTLARHRLTDLIRARTEGQTGLIVYAGDAHLLAPISDDRQTLLTLVPGLSPEIMPIRGSQTEAAIDTALRLFDAAGHPRGQIILLTDGVTATARRNINERLRDQPYSLSILGIGTPEGAPIPLRDGSFAKDSQGVIQLAKLDPRALAELALRHGGIYQNLSYDGSDIAALTAHLQRSPASALDPGAQQKLERDFDLWHEAGPWLVLLLLPLAALSHRRGWLLTLVFLLPLTPQPAQAFEWQDLWQTPDQQAEKRFQQGDIPGAAELFESPEWRGSALYRAEQFEQAAEQFDRSDSPRAHYNRGNALARGDKLDEALQAYEQALARDPEFDAARANQQLVQKLLKQQQEQEQEQQDSDGESGEPGEPGEPGESSESQQGSKPESDSESKPGSKSDAQSEAEQQPDASDDADSSDSQPGQSGAEQDSDQDSKAASEAEQAQASEREDESEFEGGDSAAAQAEAEAETVADKTQSIDPRLEKWLQQLPDDPSGLLRRKFEYQYQQKLEAYRQGLWQPPQESRW